jgi:hypothetical protein
LAHANAVLAACRWLPTSAPPAHRPLRPPAQVRLGGKPLLLVPSGAFPAPLVVPGATVEAFKEATGSDGGAAALRAYDAAHSASCVFDGRADSFFWTDGGLAAGATVTVRLPAGPGAGAEAAPAGGVMEFKSASVATGSKGGADRPKDRCEECVLELLPAGGADWVKLADVGSDGTAVAVLAGAQARVQALRLRVLAPQESWLQVRSLELERG